MEGRIGGHSGAKRACSIYYWQQNMDLVSSKELIAILLYWILCRTKKLMRRGNHSCPGAKDTELPYNWHQRHTCTLIRALNHYEKEALDKCFMVYKIYPEKVLIGLDAHHSLDIREGLIAQSKRSKLVPLAIMFHFIPHIPHNRIWSDGHFGNFCHLFGQGIFIKIDQN